MWQAVVHEAFYDCMGGTKRNLPNGRSQLCIPHYIPPPQAPRVDQAGTPFANFDWSKPPSHGNNDSECHRITDIVLQRVSANPTSVPPNVIGDPKNVFEAVRGYFGTVRGAYIAQNTDGGRARRERKNDLNKRRQRKKQKADDLRKQTDNFRAFYGEEETVGLEDLIQTDWMSSEHDDPGNVTVEQWKQHRLDHNGGTNGIEVRKEGWRSKQLNRTYARLRKFDRDTANDTVVGQNQSRSGKVRLPRFRGIKANTNCRHPISATKTPYTPCVSRAWAACSENNMVRTSEDFTDYTIFDLDIPDADLDAEDLRYLADDEDSDDENVQTEDGA
ncbi:hypothetical protein PLICRDRAFT_386169 [Plicaturopsis crispa FD-325 SS-3]|nr:hypothetical protein PLICRDRAFT_386169 [Plicaturopsis crispa FD-325 SS-3]